MTKSELETKKSQTSLKSVPSLKLTWRTVIASRIRHRIHIFCQETTINGFRELYASRKWWQKMIWVLVILGCTTCFVVQTHIQLKQALCHKKAARVHVLHPEDEYVFPTLVLAIPAWAWIDPRKLAKYNITSEEFIVAKSLLKGSADRIDPDWHLDMVKQELNRKAREFGIAGVGKFFSSLARDNAAGLTMQRKYGNGTAVKKRIFLGDTCYHLLNTSGAVMTPFGHSYIIDYIFNFKKFDQYLNESMQYWGENEVSNDTKFMVLTKLRPWLHSQDFNGHIFIRPGYQYTVHYNIRIYHPLDDCNTDFNGELMYHPDDCKNACQIKANFTYKVNSCYFYTTALQQYSVDAWPLCSKGFHVNNNLTYYGGRDQPEYRNLTEKEMENREIDIGKCRKNCRQACSQWLTSASFTATEFLDGFGAQYNDLSWIEIFYPSRSSIIVMEEYSAYEWHDLASDIGGLLGLWLGASIMSLWQVIHLCIWAPDNV